MMEQHSASSDPDGSLLQLLHLQFLRSLQLRLLQLLRLLWFTVPMPTLHYTNMRLTASTTCCDRPHDGQLLCGVAGAVCGGRTTREQQGTVQAAAAAGQCF